MTATRDRAVATLGRETQIDARVASLRASAMANVDRLAARANVRGVERVLENTRKQSAGLAGVRRDEIRALLDTLEARLDATRRLRLALDQWELKVDALREFERGVNLQLRELAKGTTALEDIRKLAGPSSGALEALEKRLAGTTSRLSTMTVPADGRSIHAVLTSAVQLATNAASLRRAAIASGDLQRAWDASAAAAGALLLQQRVREDVAKLTRPPQLP
jgi:hypothetical protein